MSRSERLGVAFGWNQLAFEELRSLVQHAEALGYASAYVDGDVTQMPSRGEGDVLDGWTVTSALVLATQRIEIASMRLVHHWNAARLAQALATLERIAPGRQRFLVSIGSRPEDRHFGLAPGPVGARISHLVEALEAIRGLLRGESVHTEGQHVQLAGAHVRPTPPAGRPPFEIAARGPRMLRVVAAYGDAWNVNLPPLAHRVLPAVARLEAACRALHRDPARVERVLAVFARPGQDPDDPRVPAAFRRWNPWHDGITDAEIPEAMLAGDSAVCRARLAWIRSELGIQVPLLDLSGLDADAARHALDALAPTPLGSGESCVDSGTCST